MLHTKTMTVDGIIANVGSANFNARSLKCDEEINVVVFDPLVVRYLDRQFDNDLERSIQIDLRRWNRRSLCQHAAEHLVGPVRGVSHGQADADCFHHPARVYRPRPRRIDVGAPMASARSDGTRD